MADHIQKPQQEALGMATKNWEVTVFWGLVLADVVLAIAMIISM
jgi:hypothetical protein